MQMVVIGNDDAPRSMGSALKQKDQFAVSR
jgi:hypothetical protein